MPLLKGTCRAVLPALLALSLASCSGEPARTALPAQPASAAAWQALLPAPGELLRRSSTTQSPRAIAAIEHFETANTIETLDETLFFQPDFPAAGADFSALAFALYELGLVGNEEEITLELLWADPPGRREDIHVGLVDFAHQRWRWFQPDAENRVATGGHDDFVMPEPSPDAGRVFVAVLLTGEDSGELTWLRLGGNAAPHIMLNPAAIFAEEDSVVSAEAKVFDVEDHYSGAVFSYLWDLDGDETADFPNQPVVLIDLAEPEPLLQIEERPLRLEALDSEGAQSSAEILLTVYPFADYPLKEPLNFAASDGEFGDHVHLSWEHGGGSVLPESYGILRFSDGNPIPVFLGNVEISEPPQFDDFTAEPGEVCTYYITRFREGYFHSESVSDTGFAAES